MSSKIGIVGLGVMGHNLIQAQRDYFGAYTYRRVDRDGTFHIEWTNS